MMSTSELVNCPFATEAAIKTIVIRNNGFNLEEFFLQHPRKRDSAREGLFNLGDRPFAFVG